MTYGFYLLACLILIVLQTAVMPTIPVLDRFFDLPAVFVIYLGLFRPIRECLPVTIVLGIIADNLSGAPFMLYTTSFIWLYLGVYWLKGVLQVGMRFRLPIIVSAGVLLENIIFIVTVGLLEPGSQSPVATAGTVITQLLWAFIIGPFLVIGFKYSHNFWDKLLGEVLIKRTDLTELEK